MKKRGTPAPDPGIEGIDEKRGTPAPDPGIEGIDEKRGTPASDPGIDKRVISGGGSGYF